MNIRHFFSVSLLLISIYLLISCGLPSYIVIEAPVKTTGTTATTEVSFKAPSDSSHIDGYEIYYKIYPFNSTKIDTDRELFNIASSSYVYEFGETKLVKNKFQRLQYGEMDSQKFLRNAPLIPASFLPPGSELVIEFISEDISSITANGSYIGIPLRIVFQIGDTLKNFGSNVNLLDSDRNGVTPGTPYSISFVAYSRRHMIETAYNNSVPVFLGTIKDRSN